MIFQVALAALVFAVRRGDDGTHCTVAQTNCQRDRIEGSAFKSSDEDPVSWQGENHPTTSRCWRARSKSGGKGPLPDGGTSSPPVFFSTAGQPPVKQGEEDASPQHRERNATGESPAKKNTAGSSTERADAPPQGAHAL
ncbi:hypothetical protein MTO96_019074 [Rhipicephalus appendiculatus]